MAWLAGDWINGFWHIGPKCGVPYSMNGHFNWLWLEQSYCKWAIHKAWNNFETSVAVILVSV